MASLADDPATQRLRLLERVAKLEALLRDLIPLADIGRDRLRVIYQQAPQTETDEAACRAALAQADRDLAAARELVGL